jgi:hypothetical protein
METSKKVNAHWTIIRKNHCCSCLSETWHRGAVLAKSILMTASNFKPSYLLLEDFQFLIWKCVIFPESFLAKVYLESVGVGLYAEWQLSRIWFF